MAAPLGIWIVRKEAEPLGRRLASGLGGELCAWPDASSSNLEGGAPATTGTRVDAGMTVTPPSGALSNREAFAASYPNYRQWVLVMTTGIAVRYLQGLPKNKASDPGVVVIDEGARFAISLLGGHEGGANALAYRVANLTGSVPVITTATETLKPLVVGIGCRKGIEPEKIHAAVDAALAKIGRDSNDIREIATIDLKGEEPGLIAFCQEKGLALRIISTSLIKERPWVTQPSDWVRSNIGVDGVCEPSALLATHRGTLILPKTSMDGVTVAIVEEAHDL